MIDPYTWNSLPSRPPEIPPDVFYFTNVKIVKVALYAFAALCSIGAVATLTGHLTIPITLPCHPAIPLISLAILCVGLARWIKDYKDPRELQKMQIEARDLSYLQLTQIHGVKNIILYKLLPKKEDKDEFCSFFKTLSVDSLSLKREDKDWLKDYKVMIDRISSSSRVQNLLGSSYEGAMNSHERRFKDWVLKRA